MLLRFRVENHKSIRDEVELSLVAASQRRRDDDWASSALPVAGIYGANASGKSTLLDAIRFATGAVHHSGTAWAKRKSFPHRAFLLDDMSAEKPSTYEFDFVISNVRHIYGFSVVRSGVLREWLYSYPQKRRRTVFERIGDTYTFRRGLDSELSAMARLTRSVSLFLSTPAASDHAELAPAYQWLTEHTSYAGFSPDTPFTRIQSVRDALETDPEVSQRLQRLLPEADLGLLGLSVEVREVSPRTRKIFEKMLEAVSDDGVELDVESLVNEVSRDVRFNHAATVGVRQLKLDEESTGTIAWLSLIVPALRALDRGGLLLIDEIDSSLHPKLTASLIRLFADAWPTRRAQLVFTSHDTSLLNPASDVALPRDSIWFTEKAADGATSLYSLSEFAPRAGHNIERRYLQGRYGAVPVVADSLAGAALDVATTGGPRGDGTV